MALPGLTCQNASNPTSRPKTSFHYTFIIFVVLCVGRSVTNAFFNFSRFPLLHGVLCLLHAFPIISIILSPPFLIPILSFILSFFSYHRSLYFTLPTLSHSHSFFFPTTVRRRCLGAVVLQMSDGNEGNAGRKTQRLCFIFPLHVLLFNFFHSMFIVSSKATFFFPTTVRRRCLGAVVLQMPDKNDGDAERKTQRLCFVFPLYVLFFLDFFTTCALFLLKLSFLSQKASIFISKLHECASFSLSMYFFFDYFYNMFIVSSKATIFIS